MTAHFLLKQWLDGPKPYQKGLTLAEHHGGSQQLLQLLRTGENPVSRRRLIAEIQRLVDAADAQGPAPGATPASESTPAPATLASIDTPAAAAPEQPAPVAPELLQLRAARSRGFKIASDLFSQLKRSTDKEERKQLAKRIKQIFRENQRMWDDEEYFNKFGFFPAQLPAAAPLDKSDLVAVERRRNTLRTYISSKRGKPEKQAQWEAEIQELNRILNNG